jgi:hypothetical protein
MANSNLAAAEDVLYKLSQLVRHDYEVQKRAELHAMGGYVERLHKGRVDLTPDMLASIARMQHMSSTELRQYIHHTNDAFINNLVDNDAPLISNFQVNSTLDLLSHIQRVNPLQHRTLIHARGSDSPVRFVTKWPFT